MPTARPRRGVRRTRAGAAAAAVLLVFACSDKGSDNDGAPASTPATTSAAAPSVAPDGRLTDTKAGISYVLPAGWSPVQNEQLAQFFTTVIRTNTPESGAGEDNSAFGGSGLLSEETTAGGLKGAAGRAAASFAEFFYPHEGKKVAVVDEARQVDGRDGWHVQYAIELADPGQPPVQVHLLAVALDKPAFLVVLTTAKSPAVAGQIKQILDSVRVVA